MSYLLKYLSIAETCRIKDKWRRNAVGSEADVNGLPKPNASSSVCKAPATLTRLDISPCLVWPDLMCFWNMASSSVTGTPSRMAHIQKTHVHMDVKTELNSLILMQFSLKKNLICVTNTGNQFFFTSPHCLFPSVALSRLCSLSASILKQYNTLLMGTCFRSPYTWGRIIFSDVLFSFWCPWVKRLQSSVQSGPASSVAQMLTKAKF